ncbi:11325_t:CDS:1 [Dentiscutata heterogama]|uniref:11325_t:CDS:1 n=1 Tax=Dentiscutata heterogama TaxID=1316150 RepID=A0ACA9NSA3_9GLOM|nr:11325_t:CDS:1 [Dentiscutata heterogama]
MDKTQNDNACPPLNKHVIFSEPPSSLSSEQNTSVSSTVRGISRPKSRKTIDVVRSNHKEHKPRSFSLDSGYRYYHHPQYNIYNRNDNNYEHFCCAYEPQLPESLIERRERRHSSPKYPIYGYSSSDDKLYDSPSTKLYPYTNIFMGNKVNNKKNGGSENLESGKVNNEKNGDSENLESGKEITKEFLYNFEAWKEQLFCLK